MQGGWAGWRAKGRAAWEASFEAPAQPSPVDMVAVTAHLREVLPEDVILTNGAGNFTVWPNKFFKFGRQARLLAPQSGAMGYGLPAAVAAKVACPERVVVCFAGDGDFQMSCQELGTAMQAGAQPIVLMLNNGIYGTIRAHQERNYPGRVSGTTMENPDFTMLARAYGYHAERVERTEDFPAAFERALASRTGAVLDLDDLARGADAAADPQPDARGRARREGGRAMTDPTGAGNRGMSPRFDTILLTGAAGRLGTHLRRGLAPLARRLRVSDRVEIADLRPNEEPVLCELADAGAVLEMTRGVEAIVHFGGAPRETNWETDPQLVDRRQLQRLRGGAAERGEAGGLCLVGARDRLSPGRGPDRRAGAAPARQPLRRLEVLRGGS